MTQSVDMLEAAIKPINLAQVDSSKSGMPDKTFSAGENGRFTKCLDEERKSQNELFPNQTENQESVEDEVKIVLQLGIPLAPCMVFTLEETSLPDQMAIKFTQTGEEKTGETGITIPDLQPETMFLTGKNPELFDLNGKSDAITENEVADFIYEAIKENKVNNSSGFDAVDLAKPQFKAILEKMNIAGTEIDNVEPDWKEKLQESIKIKAFELPQAPNEGPVKALLRFGTNAGESQAADKSGKFALDGKLAPVLNQSQADQKVSDFNLKSTELFKGKVLFDSPGLKEILKVSGAENPIDPEKGFKKLTVPGTEPQLTGDKNVTLNDSPASQVETEKLWINRSDFSEQVSKIMQDSARMREGDRRSIEIQLIPERLGKVEISLRIEKGELRSEFICRPETAQVIEEGIPRLREALSQAGITLGDSFIGTQRDSTRDNTANQDDSNTSKQHTTGQENNDDLTTTINSTTNLSRYDFLI